MQPERSHRPGFFQLIPYTNYSDTLNITHGNPALLPQFTETFEIDLYEDARA